MTLNEITIEPVLFIWIPANEPKNFFALHRREQISVLFLIWHIPLLWHFVKIYIQNSQPGLVKEATKAADVIIAKMENQMLFERASASLTS